MPEWSNGPDSKSGVLLAVPGVRIPFSPLKVNAKRQTKSTESHKTKVLWDFCFMLCSVRQLKKGIELVSHGCVKATCLEGISEGFEIELLKHGHTNWNKDAQIKIIIAENELSKQGIFIQEINNLSSILTTVK